LDDTEDLYSPGVFVIELTDGESLTFVVSTDANAVSDFETAQAEEIERRRMLITSTSVTVDQDWVAQLILAADQFIVTRRSRTLSIEHGLDGHSVIAGYPWFGDWGRDTMIALPGLTLTTGRFEVARSILLTFAQHLDRGMLPNRFPDVGDEPEYNTVDATLWYVSAIEAYTRHSRDLELAAEVFAALVDIVAWHRRGTRYRIHVDPDDGLLWAGEDGVQLTWMDAKVGDWVVTPRVGKAVEINALWYNALRAIAGLATQLGKHDIADELTIAAEGVKTSFARFWNQERGCLYDVIDGPAGEKGADGRRHDPSLRPNQIFAVSLPHSPLDPVRQRAVVDTCARHLVTSFGLRSLAQGHPDYVGRYGGDQRSRDGAYHQGTVWPWLLGPFAEAHFRVHGDVDLARSFLRPLGGHLRHAGIGSVSEIFDGDPPHGARGCFAQAWSVAETLRVWSALAQRT
jgi:predicted glycogen debranching enzyme